MLSINLRAEMLQLMGEENEQDTMLFRHLLDIKCPCQLQPPTIYSDKIKANIPNPIYRTTADPACPNCEGLGWIFEEYIVVGKMFYPRFKVAHEQEYHYGITKANAIHIYLPVTDVALLIEAGDIFYMLDADDKGNLIDPIVRKSKWLINDVYPFRLDNNKLEFVKLFAKAQVV